jgi:hypothetical protein
VGDDKVGCKIDLFLIGVKIIPAFDGIESIAGGFGRIVFRMLSEFYGLIVIDRIIAGVLISKKIERIMGEEDGSGIVQGIGKSDLRRKIIPLLIPALESRSFLKIGIGLDGRGNGSDGVAFSQQNRIVIREMSAVEVESEFFLHENIGERRWRKRKTFTTPAGDTER